MKKIKGFICLLAVVLLFGAVACTDMLKEEPRSSLTPIFFESASGLKAGITASYSTLRYLFGTDGSLSMTVVGTDEFHSTDQLTGGHGALDTYGEQYAPTNSDIPNYWNNGLQTINTCNGVVKYAQGEVMGLSDNEKTALIGEARFLRGFYYFLLAMHYGDIPLDLGSGRLEFNSTPSTTSVRAPRAEVFDVVIEDFQYAVENLPTKQTEPGRAFKASALHFLAKAYLSRAGLQEAKSDDYQNAYKTAKELIDNAAQYGVGLTADYATVHLEGHENDPEVLFNVQRTWTASGPNFPFEEPSDGLFTVENKGNRANFFFTPGYENVRVDGAQIVPRNIEYQRPWRMFLPTKWLVFNAFEDKTNDSRWDKSFRLEWNAGIKFSVKGREVNPGEPAIKVSLNQTETAAATDSVGENGVIFKPYALYYWGMLYNAKGEYLNGGVQYMYPNLVKFDDTKRPHMNYNSNRSFILARLAETHLIAAEAAMLSGNKAEAAKQINVVRTRAAYPGHEANMQIKESDVTIDFILDERTRELCGEGWRWMDLARTGKLLERAKAHNYLAAPNIKSHHVLRPIPQTQIDLLSDPAQKAAYQNAGY